MDAKRRDTSDSGPSPGDEDVRQALAALDVKLAAYTAAMRELERRPAERDEPEPPDDSAGQAPPAAVAAPLDEPAQAVQPAGSGLIGSVGESAEPDVASEVDVPEPAPPSAAGRSEDEKLLASLDEETANAIRVMRRLNPAGKSVRELLDQYRATHTTAEAGPARKTSWFSRRR